MTGALAILIPISLGMGLVGLATFFWAMRKGQFDDPEGNAWRVITPQDPPTDEGSNNDDLAADPADRDPARRL